MFLILIQTNITFFLFWLIFFFFSPLEEIFATRYPFKWILNVMEKEAYH